MLCTKCGKRPAAVHMKQWVNGQEKEEYLCEECAEAANVWSFGALDLNKLFSSSFGGAAAQAPSCPGCGMSLAEFNSSGRLGCSRCYETFGDQLGAVIAKFHGGRRHVGKVRAATSAELLQDPGLAELNYQRLALQKQLDELVSLERFEEAAKVRDQIKELMARMGKSQSKEAGEQQ